MDVEPFLQAFVRWAEPRRDVHAVLLVGSHARTDPPADQWSDVDLALVVDDPDRYLADEGWVESFGRPLLTFVEPTAVGRAIERRVLYEGGLDIDVAVFTPDWLGTCGRGARDRECDRTRSSRAPRQDRP